MRAAAAIRHPLSFAGGGGGEAPLQKKASPRRIWTRLREPRDECCAKDAKRRCKCVAAAAAAHELCAGGRACCLAEGNLGLLCNTCVRSRFILMHTCEVRAASIECAPGCCTQCTRGAGSIPLKEDSLLTSLCNVEHLLDASRHLGVSGTNTNPS